MPNTLSTSAERMMLTRLSHGTLKTRETLLLISLLELKRPVASLQVNQKFQLRL